MRVDGCGDAGAGGMLLGAWGCERVWWRGLGPGDGVGAGLGVCHVEVEVDVCSVVPVVVCSMLGLIVSCRDKDAVDRRGG